MSTNQRDVSDQVRDLRVKLKQAALDSDDLSFSRVEMAVRLNGLWQKRKDVYFSTPDEHAARREELEGYVRNMGLGYAHFATILEYFPRKEQWRGKCYRQMWRDACCARDMENIARSRRVKEESSRTPLATNPPQEDFAVDGDLQVQQADESSPGYWHQQALRLRWELEEERRLRKEERRLRREAERQVKALASRLATLKKVMGGTAA